jgi:hypothetical protein
MPKGLTLAYSSRKTDSGLIEQLESWIASCKVSPSLIIIDMLQQVKGSQRKTEDAYAGDSRILEILHDLGIKHNMAILCVVHTRKKIGFKTDDDPFAEIIGSTAQFGTADCAWMIIGKRKDERKRFCVLCRDNDAGQLDYEATFHDHRWNINGSAEACEEEREITEYNRNPVVFTLRKLVEESPSGWIGTMTKLIEEVMRKTNQYPAGSPEQMRKILDSIEYRLSCEGIMIKALDPNGGKRGRRCKIYAQAPEQQQIDY